MCRGDSYTIPYYKIVQSYGIIQSDPKIYYWAKTYLASVLHSVTNNMFASLGIKL